MHSAFNWFVQAPEHSIIFMSQFVRPPAGIRGELQFEQSAIRRSNRCIHTVVAVFLSPEVLYVHRLIATRLQMFECSVVRLHVAFIRQTDGEADDIVDPIEKIHNALVGDSLGKVLPPQRFRRLDPVILTQYLRRVGLQAEAAGHFREHSTQITQNPVGDRMRIGYRLRDLTDLLRGQIYFDRSSGFRRIDRRFV